MFELLAGQKNPMTEFALGHSARLFKRAKPLGTGSPGERFRLPRILPLGIQ